MWLPVMLLAIIASGYACPDSCRCTAPVIECRGRMPQLDELDQLPADFGELVVHEVDQKHFRPFVGSMPNSTFLQRLWSLQLTNCSTLTDLHYLYWDVLKSGSGNFPVLPNVRLLNVSHNSLTDLQGYRRVDQKIANQLRTLDASYNQISTISLMDFRHTPQLTWLSLANNKLDYVSPNNFKPLEALEYLDVSNNILHNLEGIFDSLKSLQHLNVAGNKLEHVQASWLQNLSKLVELDISRNKLTFIPADTLQPLTSLSVFKLAENPLIERDLSLLLGTGRRLESVDASRIGLIRVPAALTHSVRTLKLMGNQLTSINSGDLDSYPLLKTLDISDNRLMIIEEDALGRLEGLEELVLSGNLMPFIPKSLPSGLKILNLRQNAISKLKTNDLQGLYLLKYLDLSGNVIGSIEEESFHQLPALETLDISDNPIKKLPSGTLSGPSNLVTLRMSGLMSLEVEQNQNQDTAFPILTLERLVTLDISRSPVLAAQLLADNAALPACKSLQKLNLSYTNISAIRSDLAFVLPQLQILNLVGNKWNCSNDQFWLGEWLRKHETSIKYSTKCTIPPGLEGKPLEKMPNMPNLITSTRIAPTTLRPNPVTRNISNFVNNGSDHKKSFNNTVELPTVSKFEEVVTDLSPSTSDVKKTDSPVTTLKLSIPTQPTPEIQEIQNITVEEANKSLDSSLIKQNAEKVINATNEEELPNVLTTGKYEEHTSKIAISESAKIFVPTTTSISSTKMTKAINSITTVSTIDQTPSTTENDKEISTLLTTSAPLIISLSTKATTVDTLSYVNPTRKETIFTSKNPPIKMKHLEPEKVDESFINKFKSTKKDTMIYEKKSKNQVISEFSRSKLLRANEDPHTVNDPIDTIEEISSHVTQSGARISETITSGAHPGMLILLGAAIGAAAALTVVLSRRATVKRRDRQYQRHENIEVHALTPTIDLW